MRAGGSDSVLPSRFTETGVPEHAMLLRQRESAATARNIAVVALQSILSGASDPKAVAARALNEIRQAYDERVGQ